MELHENTISGRIINICFEIHSQLGQGLFESVYETILHHELLKEGFHVEKQKAIPVVWDGMALDQGFKADLIVENKVLIEIKSVAALADVHKKQVLTYLKLTGLKLGLLINFNDPLLKDGISRTVNKL